MSKATAAGTNRVVPQQSKNEAPRVPAQRSAADVERSPLDDVAIPSRASWTESTTQHVAANAIFFLLLGGTIAAVIAAIVVRTPAAGAFAGACVAATVLVRGLLASRARITVELRNSMLEVSTTRSHELFNLAEPLQRIRTRGEPGTSGWQIALTRPDGSERTLTSREVDSLVLAAVVRRYRKAAENVAAERRHVYEP